MDIWKNQEAGDNLAAFMASIDDRERTFNPENIARRQASLTAYLQDLMDEEDP